MFNFTIFIIAFTIIFIVLLLVFILKIKTIYRNNKPYAYLFGGILLLCAIIATFSFSIHKRFFNVLSERENHLWRIIDKKGKIIGELPDTVEFNIKYRKIGSYRKYYGGYLDCFYAEAFTELKYDTAQKRFFQITSPNNPVYERNRTIVNKSLRNLFSILTKYQNYKVLSYSEGFFLVRCFLKLNSRRKSFTPRFFYVDTIGERFLLANNPDGEYDLFTSAAPFNKNVALVSQASCGNCYFINTKGEKISKTFNFIYPLHENYYAANSNTGIVYLTADLKRRLRLKVEASFGGCFADGLACVRNKGGSLYFRDKPTMDEDDTDAYWGYVDTSGNWAIPPKFHHSNDFSEGLAAVKDTETGKWGFIDRTGKWKIKPQFDKATFFIYGIAAVAYDK